MHIEIKRLVDAAYSFCDMMDEKGIGIKRFTNNEETSRECLESNLFTFAAYLSASDGIIASEEAETISELIDCPFSSEIIKDFIEKTNIYTLLPEGMGEYYGAAEPPVRCGESHLSGLTEPPQFVY